MHMMMMTTVIIISVHAYYYDDDDDDGYGARAVKRKGTADRDPVRKTAEVAASDEGSVWRNEVCVADTKPASHAPKRKRIKLEVKEDDKDRDKKAVYACSVPIASGKSEFHEGDMVQARYNTGKGADTWYDAVVVSVMWDGRYLLKWENLPSRPNPYPFTKQAKDVRRREGFLV